MILMSKYKGQHGGKKGKKTHRQRRVRNWGLKFEIQNWCLIFYFSSSEYQSMYNWWVQRQTPQTLSKDQGNSETDAHSTSLFHQIGTALQNLLCDCWVDEQINVRLVLTVVGAMGSTDFTKLLFLLSIAQRLEWRGQTQKDGGSNPSEVEILNP